MNGRSVIPVIPLNMCSVPEKMEVRKNPEYGTSD